MKKIVIVGAGGFGREMLGWVQQHPSCGKEWEVVGFLDDRADALDGFDYSLRVIHGIGEYRPSPDDLLLMALGNPATKKKIAESLLASGAKFMTFVHPSAIVGNHVELGEGAVICPRCVLTSDIIVGDFAMYNVASTSGHDVRVGDYCTLSGQCELTGGVVLEEGVFLGCHALVIPGKRIGAWATVGAGAVVISNVKPGTTVFGNPAKRIV